MVRCLTASLQDIAAEDEAALAQFMPKEAPARITLADVIMSKIKDQETEIESHMSGGSGDESF